MEDLQELSQLRRVSTTDSAFKKELAELFRSKTRISADEVDTKLTPPPILVAPVPPPPLPIPPEEPTISDVK